VFWRFQRSCSECEDSVFEVSEVFVIDEILGRSWNE